jgi:hypothetical protein
MALSLSLSVLIFLFATPYSATIRTNMGKPFDKPGKMHKRDALNVFINFAVNTIPTPRSSIGSPTDNANHWGIWYMFNGVRPPWGAIRAFIMYIQRQQVPFVQQPLSGAHAALGDLSGQTNSDSSGSGNANIDSLETGALHPPDEDGGSDPIQGVPSGSV